VSGRDQLLRLLGGLVALASAAIAVVVVILLLRDTVA
jgi:hypothetical protein